MVAPRKPKKKNASVRIIIAVGIALVLGLGLLVLMLSTKGTQSTMQNQVATLQKQIEDQKKAIEEQKQIDLLNKAKAQSNQNTPIAPQKSTVSVVVAKRPISAGTRLTVDMLDTMEFPETSAPANSENFAQSLVGRITSSDMAVGEPVLDNKLIDKDTETLAIPAGHRAMTLPFGGSSSVGGFITPGARVDLISVMPKTSAGKDIKSGEMISKVLLQNVKVLATAGTQDTANLSPKEKKGSSGANSASITLAIPADQAIKLALAYNNGQGNIQVLLRSYSDNGSITKTEMDTNELVLGVKSNQKKAIKLPEISLPKPPSDSNYSAGASNDLNSILSNPAALPPPEMPAPQTKTHSIEIIQANSRQDVSFETEM